MLTYQLSQHFNKGICELPQIWQIIKIFYKYKMLKKLRKTNTPNKMRFKQSKQEIKMGQFTIFTINTYIF